MLTVVPVGSAIAAVEPPPTPAVKLLQGTLKSGSFAVAEYAKSSHAPTPPGIGNSERAVRNSVWLHRCVPGNSVLQRPLAMVRLPMAPFET